MEGSHIVKNIEKALRGMMQQWSYCSSVATERQDLFVTDNRASMMAILQAEKIKEVVYGPHSQPSSSGLFAGYGRHMHT